MPTKYTVTVSYMGTSSVIAIPKPVCDGFGIQKGDKLDLIVRDDGLYIPVKERNPMVERIEQEIDDHVKEKHQLPKAESQNVEEKVVKRK
jgi:AbrB family looped-hinge helix DNA binding protein